MDNGYIMHYGVKGMKWGVRHDPKRGYKRASRSLSNKNKALTSKEIAEREHRKEIAKKVAIGVAIGAAAGLVIVAAKPGTDLGVIYGKRGINNIRSDLQIGSKDISTMPISELGNQDLILEKGKTTLQRVTKDSIEAESAKDIVYAVHTQNDKNIYKSYFGITNAPHSIRDKRPSQIQTRDIVSDIKGPSERRRAMYFMQEVNANPEFKAALERDLSRTYGRKIKVDSSHSRRYYRDFLHCFGDANSESRGMYVNKLARHGYNMVPDDNDRSWMGSSPIILTDASNTTVIAGQRAKTNMDTINGIIKANSFAIHEDLQWNTLII